MNSELTPRAIVLACLLSVVMAAANVYLGLKVGMTVSASIPSAVLSMLILRRLRSSNVLEHNLVQTAASAGESLAAGFIFTLPALVLIGQWSSIPYFETVAILALGGIMGVVFSVPLRRLFIVEEQLRFPEGIATYQILQTGSNAAGTSGRYLVFSGVFAGVVKLLEGGFGLWKEVIEKAILFNFGGGRSWLLYFGSYLSPALLGVGFIVGLNVSLVVFAGGALSWLLALPLLALDLSLSPEELVSEAYRIWNSKIRYLGVGAMLVGGLWTLICLRSKVLASISKVFFKSEQLREEKTADLSRTILGALLLFVIVGAFLVARTLGALGLSPILVILLVVVCAFLFSVVSGYMAGLVGSSNNPVSGVTIATVLLSGLLFSLFVAEKTLAMGLSIAVGAFVCCAAAIAGDNLQDLKAGHLLNATPYRQQIMQLLGVLSAALVLPPVLSLLHEAYQLGSKTLSAPQASLVAGITKGVFEQNLPWKIVLFGALLGVLCIAVDRILEMRAASFRVPVLALAVGIYLPLALSVAIAIGGFLNFLVSTYLRARSYEQSAIEARQQDGVLVASGFITGEALMGIALAIYAVLS